MSYITKMNGLKNKRCLEYTQNEGLPLKRCKSEGTVLSNDIISKEYLANVCCVFKAKQLTQPLNLKCMCLNMIRRLLFDFEPIPIEIASDPSNFKDFFDLEIMKIISEVLKQPDEMEFCDCLLPFLIKNLGSSSSTLKNEAICGFSNITWITLEIINLFIKNGVFSHMFDVMNQNDVDLMRKITKLFMKIVRQIFDLPAHLILGILQSLQNALEQEDYEVLANTMGILDNMTDSKDGSFSEIISLKYINKVVQLLSHPDLRVSRNALNIVVNYIHFADETEMLCVLDCEILPTMPAFLKRIYAQNKSLDVVIKYANISENYLQKIIDYDILKITLDLMKYGTEEVRRKSISVFKVLAEGGSSRQIAFAIEIGVIQVLIELLTGIESKTIKKALITIQSYLNHAKIEPASLKAILSKCEGLQTIIECLKDSTLRSDLKFETLSVGYLYLSIKLSFNNSTSK